MSIEGGSYKPSNIEATGAGTEHLHQTWRDGTGTHGSAIAKFIKDTIAVGNPNYDSSVGLHVDGVTGETSQDMTEANIGYVKVYYEDNQPKKIKVRYATSGTEVFVSGLALEDYLSISSTSDIEE